MRLSSSIIMASLVLMAYTQSDLVTLSGASDTTEAATTTAADYATSGITYAPDSTTLSLTATSDYASLTNLSSSVTAANSTSRPASGNSTTTSSPTATLLVGTSANGTSTTNQTASRTSSSARPTNTVPCNGHPEFCQRKYSNLTQIAAHNSPFIRQGSLAANQMLDVETQLNDGVRMRESTILLHRIIPY